MDVTFTNILEGARQYFQGLPAGTGTTASPAYSTEGHHQNDPEQNQGMPPSSNSYWPPQPTETARPPTREHTPVQRPSSHSSDSSRPSSHSQYIQGVSMEQSRIHYPSSYQEQYLTSQQHQQSFQFPRPQSREAPSNHQYQSHIPTSSPYHQTPSPYQIPSPQLPRTPSREQMVPSVPSREQILPQTPSREQSLPRVPSQEQLVPRVPSREQLVSQYASSSENYNFSQQRSYFPVQSQPKPVPSNNAYKSQTSNHSYPSTSQQQNAYYKHIYSSQAQSSQQNMYVNTKPSNAQQPEINPQQNTHPSTMSVDNTEHAFKTTHNLPPIAALSNYHSSRTTREPARTVISSSNSRTKPYTSSSYSMPSSHQNSSTTNNASSIIQQNPARSVPSTAPVAVPNYHQDYRSYTTQAQQQQYQYHSTVTTQSYNQVTMTTSSTSNYYSNPNQSQSSNQTYYQMTKSNPQMVPRSQPSVNPPLSQSNTSVDQNGRQVMKRESPLDLSVKTVRTPADSTLGDAENDARNKYFQNSRPVHSSISAQHYPQVDVHSLRQTISQRAVQLPTVTAPKVEFHPNFNVPTLNQPIRPPPKRTVEEPRRNVVPEKAHSNSRPIYDNKSTYQSGSTNRYPAVSIPTAAHVNSYIQSQQITPKTQMNNFPTSSHKTNSIYAIPPQEAQKKRSGEAAPPIVPNKIPKVDPWRQSIDLQIEQRLYNYKQQQAAKMAVPTTKQSFVNGTYNNLTQDKTKDIYPSYQKQNYENMSPHSSYNTSHYQIQNNHNQTYVPSPATHQYPGYAGFTNQQTQQSNSYLQASSRSNSNPSLTTLTNVKNNLGGAVDKRVLSLLRNSLEVKGQKKLEQLKTNENLTHHPRSDIQHPSTDVTAPLQPKPGLISRNNVSPFTPTSFPDNSNLASMYKFHIPKAIDSVNFETNKNQNSAADKQTLDTVITNHASSNSDYDGLAAFLAARIRTKGELKQGGSVTQNSSNNNTSINDVRLQGIIENQLKSPLKQDTSQSSTYYTSSSTTASSTSPIKASKERQTAFAPRKRLFSRNEEDPTNNNVPPRDKSGLRSSSETSVFDFPDSDSETDMNGRESLEAMRKGRKSSLKQSTPINLDLKIESPRPASPSDDIFAQLCDNFVEQLKSGSVKRKARRKKPMEPEVLAKLETVTKENPLENEIVVKIEAEELKQSVEIKKACEKNEDVTIEIHVDIKTEKEISGNPIPVDTNPEKDKLKIENDSKSETGSSIKTEDTIFATNKENVKRRLVSSSDTSDSETETIKIESKDDTKVTADPPNSSKSITTPTGGEQEKAADSDVKKETDCSQKRNEIVIRPAKKPSFGDGSDFYPGWEEGVYKYKKSLRMPPTLIQVSRPPQFHRLSTSLPDLDPCPQSPTTSIIADNEKDTPTKSKLKKIKSEPIDSDNESNSSFNIFNKKTNYDSEGSASVRSLPNTAKEMSILDKLLEKCGGRKKRKYKRKDDHSPKIIPKAENPVELLPTPSLQIKEAADKEEKKLTKSVIKSESALLGFRKKTINNFKDAFIKNANNIVGVNEQFATVVLKSRTRKETRVLKQRATIKEVFGEDRPASAPPVTCVNDLQIKPEIDGTACLGNLVIKLEKQDGILEKENDAEKGNSTEIELDVADPKQMLKNKLLNKGKKKEKNSLLKNLVNKKIKTEIQEEIEDDTRSLEEIVIKRDPDEKSETPSIDGDDGSVSGRRRGKFGKMRRKLSSGFDYIRKKKKIKKEAVENEPSEKRKRKILVSKNLESVDDIQKEIKTWVLNKGIGETHLHRAARLGYTDITAYCLEKMDCNPSPKDNAGYTPLHEACSRGHLDIAKLLLLYGANPSESAQGGIRPLHEAVENGFVEIARLLLSYGADPTLATYSGLTPLALTNDEITKEFLKNHLNDIEGEPSSPWTSHGPAVFFDPIEDIGFNILDNTPNADPELEEDDIEIEVSESLLPNLYTLRSEAPNDRWILLQDLSNLLKIKSRDALLRQICPPSTSSANVNYKTVLRELKMSDFLEQAHCCQFLNAGEKINTRASKIALVKYTEKVRELLNVELITINVR